MTLSIAQYQMLLGIGNYPKGYVSEAEHQLAKMSISLNQYKMDATDADYKRQLMLVDLNNLIEKYTALAAETRTDETKLFASVVVEDLKKVLTNENFDINDLL